MADVEAGLTQRERELGAIILQYNDVTERLKGSYEQLMAEAERLREELERKNRELERRERLAALGQMAAGLAHEIRNPLGGIQLYANLLKQDLAEAPELVEVVEKIGRGVRLIEGLVSDVLTFAKPSEPQRESVELGRLVDEVVDLLRPRVEQGKVTLRVDDACYDVTLEADRRQLQQILLNVLVNSIQAASAKRLAVLSAAIRAGEAVEPPQTWVELTAHVDATTGQDVVIRVSDSGQGIPGDLLQRVFNPFFTTKDSGTGLGLAIVHQLVEAHGGAITAGNHEGGGALFTIRLPASVPADEAAAVRQE